MRPASWAVVGLLSTTWPLESLIFVCAFPEETEALKSDNSLHTRTRIQRNLVSGGSVGRTMLELSF